MKSYGNRAAGYEISVRKARKEEQKSARIKFLILSASAKEAQTSVSRD
jgi:hypothetical protein